MNTVLVMSLVFGVKLILLCAVRFASLLYHNHPLVCESTDNFSSVQYGETNGENYCDNGIHVTRKCLSTGRWDVIEYYGNCSRFPIPIPIPIIPSIPIPIPIIHSFQFYLITPFHF